MITAISFGMLMQKGAQACSHWHKIPLREVTFSWEVFVS